MKFRQKPIVVEAQQWWPPGHPQHDPTMLSHRKGNQVSPPDYRKTGDIYCFAEGMGKEFGGDIYFVRVGGPNDNIQLHPGDWVVIGDKGEKSVIKPDIFETTHEPV